MDPIEKAIRTALERGDAEDQAFRERIYRSVEAALDRAIQANPQLTVEKAIARRKGLQAKISEIESEYQLAKSEDDAALDGSLDAALLDILEEAPQARQSRPDSDRTVWPSLEPQRRAPAGEPPPVETGERLSAPPAVEVEPAVRRQADPERQPPVARAGGPEPVAVERRAARMEPAVDLGMAPEPSGQAEPSMDFPAVVPPPAAATVVTSAPVPESSPEVAAERAAGPREKRRSLAATLFGIVILALFAAGLLYAFQSGLLKSPAGSGAVAHNPPATPPAQDVAPAGEGAPVLSKKPDTDQAWITVFTPANPATVATPADAKAEVMQGDDGSFLRIRSGAGGSAVTFDVGQGVLEQLAGKKAIFSVSARGADGEDTEMSIECNFGDLGNCGRRRYEVGYERAEFLFDLQMPAKKAGGGGTVAVNSDFAGKGRAIDIFEIRVSAQ